ncbi:OstA-like protein [Mucilaginibacter sp.]|uniref:OstA-like protein n=1 Tax=Mucilaginibacter sp. TaxID=1882438 RepID=UPI00261149D4|nr:OstA-like protein [Mucilaginibacter sp.]MDB4924793.1 hypothetical protein [Mucilaginibacter sp.]
MNKYVLSFLFLLATAAVFGQKKSSKVNLVSSTSLESVSGINGKKTVKVHNGVFKQDFSTLRSDSAYFYPDLNMVDAFGHVNINQGDTLNIYSDKLNYNGNTKVAILTDHVKMIDKDAILTTNYFTYNTATRIGTYTGGGKLVNKDNTLTSKNGYYFAFTRDEYFRYNVVCTTPDAVIKTDTLRYNSGSRIAYFYGPTNILGKDKDNLYTENGTYNTITEQALFGKNNLYTQGTKSLKGDSLFYDRLKGYGRATRHVTFDDKEQKMTIKGDLGEYYKADERLVMTQNPYMIFVTEDTTAVKTNDKKLTADSLFKNQKTVIADKAHIPDKKLTLKGITDSITKKLPANVNKNAVVNKKLTLQGITDSVTKKITAQANAKVPSAKQSINKLTDSIKSLTKKPGNVKYDSLFFVADTLETQVITFKAFKALKESQYQASHRDTSIKVIKKAPSIVYKKSPKFLALDAPKHWTRDTTSFLHPDYFNRPGSPFNKPVAPAAKAPPKTVVKVVPKKTAQDSLKDKRKTDSLALLAPKALSDTARIRIVNGHHHAKLFKTDLQAKADSMFYSSSDSTIRCYVNPMIWTQGSQLSGDTINLQMKNKKLDNMDMYPSAFIVNIEKNDSLHFNQAGGRTMHGIFKDNKLNNIRISGNAETIFFKRDSVTNKVTDMNRTVSGGIYATFKNGNIKNLDFYANYEAKANAIAKIKDDDKVLKGFIWKPKERPVSKEAILSAYKKPVKATVPTAKPTGKPEVKKPVDGKLKSDSTITKPPVLKMGRDSIVKDTAAKKIVRDTAIKKIVPIKP